MMIGKNDIIAYFRNFESSNGVTLFKPIFDLYDNNPGTVTSRVDAIHFDEYIKKICTPYQLRSVDAIYISNRANQIFFIEFKTGYSGPVKASEVWKDRLECIKNKLLSSTIILRDYCFNTKFTQDYFDNSLEFYFLLVFDNNSISPLASRSIGFLIASSDLTHLSNLNIDYGTTFNNFFKPFILEDPNNGNHPIVNGAFLIPDTLFDSILGAI